MRTTMKYVAFSAAGLVALVLMVVAIGYALPQGHVASRERAFAVSPEKLFAAISTPADFPAWRTGVQRVEMLPDDAGKQRFRETGSDGTITFRVEESVPPRRLVTRIADTTLAFGGSWTHELTPTPTGATLRITENGEVYNPVFRFMSRFVFGHHSSIDKYLDDLEKRVLAAP